METKRVESHGRLVTAGPNTLSERALWRGGGQEKSRVVPLTGKKRGKGFGKKSGQKVLYDLPTHRESIGKRQEKKRDLGPVPDAFTRKGQAIKYHMFGYRGGVRTAEGGPSYSKEVRKKQFHDCASAVKGGHLKSPERRKRT